MVKLTGQSIVSRFAPWKAPSSTVVKPSRRVTLDNEVQEEKAPDLIEVMVFGKLKLPSDVQVSKVCSAIVVMPSGMDVS